MRIEPSGDAAPAQTILLEIQDGAVKWTSTTARKQPVGIPIARKHNVVAGLKGQVQHRAEASVWFNK